jgi:hypothetical protein
MLTIDASFTGTVSGFTAGDTFDLTGIDFGTIKPLKYTPNAGNTGGTLTVMDSTHTAKIALLGTYMASSFVPASDGQGGTFITDPSSVAAHHI